MQKAFNILVSAGMCILVIISSWMLVRLKITEPTKREDLIAAYFKEDNNRIKSLAESVLTTEGVLYIPSIDLKTPVFTGTSEDAISLGAGIVETTGTLSDEMGNTVITSHNGSNESTLFINLDKLKKDDYFYIKVDDIIKRYQVFYTEVVSPNNEWDTFLKPGPNERYITLRTCTPVYVNTDRLHVVAKEVDLVDSIPKSKSVWSSFEIVLLVVASISFILFIISLRNIKQ